MARVRRRVDRNPYKKGIQHRPPKPRKVKVKTRDATPSRPGALALDPDQMLEYGDRIGGYTNEMAALGEDLDTAKAQRPDALASIQRDFAGQQDSVRSNLSSRGIFESSIRDIQIADVNAAQALQEKAVNDLVDAAQRAYTTRSNQINGVGGERQRTETWKNNAMAANARENTTPGTPAAYENQVDRDPGKPGIQTKPPAPVTVHVRVGGQGGGNKNRNRNNRNRNRNRSPHGDPYAR